MAFTMMATAGAAYTDQADIEATEAVEMLNALGVMTGDPDGSFRPNDTITRAEAARMIYTIRTNSDDASAYADMQTTFKDVSSDSWYAGYVKHCQAAGIISGTKADGSAFEPSRDVTTVELALMCLRVMGYDPAKADIGGSTWSTKTISLATEAGILKDVNTSTTAACPRQWAAQLMANMIQAPTVEWSTDSNSYSKYFEDGTERDSVGKEYMDLWIDIGNLTEIDGDNLTIYCDKSDAEDSDREFVGDHDFTKVSADYTALLGHKVKVLYREKTNDVIGVYALDDNTSYTVNIKDVEKDGDKVKFDGKSYGFDDSALRIEVLDVEGKVTTDEVKSDYFDIDANKSANATALKTVTFVDNDGDGKFNIAFVTEYEAAEVTYVGSDRITALKTYKMDDHNISEDLEKDDWAMISYNRFDECKDVAKAEVLSDTLNSSKDKVKNVYAQYRIGDTWYNIDISDDSNSGWDNVSVGDTVLAYVVAGVIVDIDTDDGTGAIPSNIAVVVGMGNNSLTGDQVKLRFFDGTLKTVTIDKVVDANGDPADETIGRAYKVSGSDNNTRLEELKDQKYNGYQFNATLANYNKTVGVEANDNKLYKIGGTIVDDNAVIILWEGDKDDASSKKITGKQFKAISSTDDKLATLDTAGTAAFTKKVNGAERVLMAAVEVENTDISGTSYDAYGYVTSDAYKVANGDVEFTMWDGSENLTVKVENGDTSEYVKGTLVAYSSIDSDKYLQDEVPFGTIKDMASKSNPVGEAKLYVDGNRADDAGVVTNANSHVMNITSDTHVLVVDSDADEADEIGIAYSLSDKLATAAKTAEGDYLKNMVYRVDGGATASDDADLDLLVIDNTGAFDFNKPESENAGNVSDGTVENVSWSLAKEKLTVNFDVDKDAVAVSVDYVVKSEGVRVMKGTATDAVNVYGDGTADLTLTLPGEYDKDTISVEMSNLKVLESTVSADAIVGSENGVNASVTKTADGNYKVVMEGTVQQGIPSEMNDLFNGGTVTGITAISLKGLIPAGDGSVTITQVNKAMNAYYGADTFTADTKVKSYDKGGEAEDYCLMLLNGEGATVTVVDGDTTTVYTIVNGVTITA